MGWMDVCKAHPCEDSKNFIGTGNSRHLFESAVMF